MGDDVYALRGQFVVEVGVRLAWPFLTFCDDALPSPNETRLYIDTIFRVEPGRRCSLMEAPARPLRP